MTCESAAFSDDLIGCTYTELAGVCRTHNFLSGKVENWYGLHVGTSRDGADTRLVNRPLGVYV